MSMSWRLTIVLAWMVALAGVQPPPAGQQNPYRLKDPDQTKLCLGCHTDFQQKLKMPVVHAAVLAGECSGCHDPHVSAQPKLLSGDLRELCASCHGNVIPEQAMSAHKPVADGQCRQCHDPHASDNEKLLVKKGEELCFDCHDAIKQAVTDSKVKHSIVEAGCPTCHDPHGSDQSGHLLKKAVPALCVDCHEPDAPAFLARHQRYPVGKAVCSECHDPHGSNQPALLRNNVHAPFAGGGCSSCHQGPGSAVPFATKATGFELCKECHADVVNGALAKKQLHWPVADQKGCVNCHSPHASNQEKLLRAEPPGLCASCHADTLQRISATAVQHVPVEAGMCVACHSPHGSDGAYLIDQPSVVKLCEQCHDYQLHSASHPLGDKAVDPRNKNLRVDCLSCHKSHGTPFKKMLLAETNLELCTRCHTRFAR
jgi:predicted CXXCH cytochrome family protein